MDASVNRIRVNIVFTKEGEIRYISHLDLMRLFGRALRRARLPFEITLGFSRHPKFSVKRALKLGLESQNEEAEFCLARDIDAEEFKNRLQEQLPRGIRITGIDKVRK